MNHLRFIGYPDDLRRWRTIIQERLNVYGGSIENGFDPHQSSFYVHLSPEQREALAGPWERWRGRIKYEFKND